MGQVDFAKLDEQAGNLESADTETILSWAWENVGPRLALSTAFGASGLVLIDIARRVVPDLPVFTIDTGYLFKETLELKDRLEQKYGLAIESVHPEQTVEEQDRTLGQDLFGRDADHCCYMRKVEPLHRKLAELDGWVASLRRDQGESRRHIRVLEPFPTRGDRLVAKFNPMAKWTKNSMHPMPTPKQVCVRARSRFAAAKLGGLNPTTPPCLSMKQPKQAATAKTTTAMAILTRTLLLPMPTTKMARAPVPQSSAVA